MTLLSKGKELDDHVNKLCEELKLYKELNKKYFDNTIENLNKMNELKIKHPFDDDGFPLNDSFGG